MFKSTQNKALSGVLERVNPALCNALLHALKRVKSSLFKPLLQLCKVLNPQSKALPGALERVNSSV